MLEDVFSGRSLTVDSGDAEAAGHLLGTLSSAGNPVSKADSILDVGCGQGRLVESLLNRGIDAYGADIYDRFSSGPYQAKDRCRMISRDPYKLPFDDDSFDFVVSASVVEHVFELEAMFREIHRVLKSGGVSFHTFPSRYHLPFEPHTRVPFGGVFHPRWWIRMCAYAGLRGPTQFGLNAENAFSDSVKFFEVGIKYRSISEYRRLAKRTFGNVAFPIRAFLEHSPGGSGRLMRMLRLPGLAHILMYTRQVPLLTRKS